jgi:hypothetical protein
MGRSGTTRRRSAAVVMAALVWWGCGRTDLLGGPAFDEGLCTLEGPCIRDGVFPGPCTERHDLDADGEPDQCSFYEYGDGCLVTRAAHDFGCNGVVDVDESFVHDTRGLRVAESRSSLPDWSESWRYVYDEHERLVLVEADRDDDSEVDYRIEYDRDPDRGVLEERAFTAGELTSLTVTRYDGEGRVVMVEEHQHTCGDESVFTGDVVARRTVHVHDDPARRTTMLVDGMDCTLADGGVDQRVVMIRDLDGNLLSETTDGGPGLPDGIPESCKSYTYGERGRLVSFRIDSAEGPGGGLVCDGVPDYVVRHVYDEQGRERRLEQDVDADGGVDVYTEFFYDPCGNRTGYKGWSAAEGGTVWRHSFGFDCWW